MGPVFWGLITQPVYQCDKRFHPELSLLLKSPALFNTFQDCNRIGKKLLVMYALSLFLCVLHQLFSYDNSNKLWRHTKDRPMAFSAAVTYYLHWIFFIEAWFDIVIYKNIYRNLCKGKYVWQNTFIQSKITLVSQLR